MNEVRGSEMLAFVIIAVNDKKDPRVTDDFSGRVSERATQTGHANNLKLKLPMNLNSFVSLTAGSNKYWSPGSLIRSFTHVPLARS